MKLYNTRTKKIEELKPQNPPKVTVYSCGPTVYDYSHIGHWYTYVRIDMLIRSLRAASYQPQWVMNITDVGHLVSDADEGEDKLEKGAKREGKSAWEVAAYYTDDFMKGMKTMNMLQPNHIVKATDNIPEQIDLINKLEKKGFTYVIDDGVYFDTAKFDTYADFAQLELKEQQAGARVAVNAQKQNASDFALWKFSPKDKHRDMEWDSPWGKGFPGWHIECSAMSMKYLGETLDIHTGGIDHIPVHHTNEIAQSEAATGKRFANYWLHSNHITVDGHKVSKSLGNGIRIQEIVDKDIPPEAIRLHILESHYRTQAKFSWDGLEAAKNRLQELRAMAALRWQPTPSNDKATFEYDSIAQQVCSHLTNNLDTPQALAFLSHASSQILTVLVHQETVSAFEDMLSDLDKLLGLNLSKIKDISAAQKELVRQREAARKGQDWTKSDKLRDELLAQGIGLRDTEFGAIWFPV